MGGDDRILLVGLAALFCLASGIALTSFMRRPEYGAKPPTDDGQPAELGKRRGAVGALINAVEWSARFVVHYPQYSGCARWSTGSISTSGPTPA